MNYIHNNKGQFSKPTNNHHYKLPWHVALIILAGIVMLILAVGSRARAQSFEPLTLPLKVEAPKRKQILTEQEQAEVRAKQELILKEAEALKIKKGLEAELEKVEAELAANRKASMTFR